MNESNKGLLYCILSQIMWGILPIYWKLLYFVDSFALIAHRILWSFVFMVLLLVSIKQWKVFSSKMKEPSQLRYSLPAALIVSFNWFIYVYSIQVGEILQATLGYYISPLFLAFFGWVFFKETPRKAQLIAVFLSSIGVVLQSLSIGKFPTYAFAVGLSFAVYSAIKKRTPYDSVFSMGYETLFLLPIALITLGFARTGGWELTQSVSVGTYSLLLLAGPITVLPLLLHAYGLRSAPMSIIAFLQYLSPTIMMAVGILIYAEPFDTERLIAFSFSWVALIIFALDQWRYVRSNRMISE